jgi:hypothetical protein
MKHHLIIGYGVWSKKILNYLILNKNYKIIVKTKNKLFNYPSKIEIDNKKIFDKKNINSIHVCSPLNTHFFYLKKYSWCKRIIVEKPFLEKKSEFTKIKNIFKNKNIIVNYIDLFNPIFTKTIKDIKSFNIKKVTINYSKRSKLYKKQYDSIIDWFDHPLSIILTLFKEFPSFDIIKYKSTNRKGFQDQLQIKYFFKNFDLYINLNLTNKKQRNIEIFYNEYSRKYDFLNNNIKKKNKEIYKNKITSFENLYFKMESEQKFLNQNVNFHEKIFLEKFKIIKKIKKLK